MAEHNYPAPILKPLVLAHEGGKVDDPRDPGGRTNQGVIQRTFDAYMDSRGLPRRDVYSMRDVERDEIYRQRYWDKVRGNEVCSGLDYVLMDAGVNSGPRRSVKLLQRALGVKADSSFGPVTMASIDQAFEAGTAEVVALIRRCSAERMAFLRGLRHWPTYRRGWTRRVSEMEAEAVEMARAQENRIRDVTAGGGGAAGGGVTMAEAPIDWIPWIVAGVLVAMLLVLAYNHRARIWQWIHGAGQFVGDAAHRRSRTQIRSESSAKAVENSSDME